MITIERRGDETKVESERKRKKGVGGRERHLNN